MVASESTRGTRDMYGNIARSAAGLLVREITSAGGGLGGMMMALLAMTGDKQCKVHKERMGAH